MLDQVAQFLEMGGYAAYIWPAFAVTALGLGGLLAMSLRGLRMRERALALAGDGRPGRRRPRRPEGTAAPAPVDAPLPGAGAGDPEPRT